MIVKKLTQLPVRLCDSFFLVVVIRTEEKIPKLDMDNMPGYEYYLVYPLLEGLLSSVLCKAVCPVTPFILGMEVLVRMHLVALIFFNE